MREMHDEILAARERIRGRVRETPVLLSTVLSEVAGAPVMLKCENLQRTGSFKPRGAMNMLATLSPPAAVVTASAGNHAQGVALAASEFGLSATVVMPRTAPIAKQHATAGYGAAVELVDGTLADAIQRAEAIASERGLVFVPPFDHPLIVSGQGTLGLEVLEQEPDVRCVLVPAGGGGLLAGVAAAVKSVRPDVRIVGVQTAAMPGIVRSLEAGAPVAAPAVRTLADGAAVAGPSALTLDLIRRHVDEVVTVSEEAIAQAIVLLMERSRLVVEGAGALTTAAILGGAVTDPGHTVCVVSGGNIDLNVLGRVSARGLVLAGRHRTLTVAAANTPGELARVTSAIAEAGANILEVRHDLVTADLPVAVARITFRLEVADPAAFDHLLRSLMEGGLVAGVATDLSTPAAAETPH
ncbi:MAG: threonine ammonia-lyase [Dehalococcoidia bacterium]|nr:threonine ammonia-lyase [Dehalococcoidia bacterium]